MRCVRTSQMDWKNDNESYGLCVTWVKRTRMDN